MSYQSMDAEWCKALVGSYSAAPIDDDAHDESDVGPGSHRFLTTKTRYQRSWTRRSITKAERDAIIAFYETHKTVLFFYWINHFDSTTHLVRFAAPISEKPLFSNTAWDLELSVEDV